jgi:hypothetical protein
VVTLAGRVDRRERANLMRDLRSPSATDAPVAPDVGDILLWRLAVDVAATHQPGPGGRCASLLCTGQPTYPCPPAAAAQRAAQAAHRAAPTARGRAPVPAAATGRATPPPPVATGRASLIGAALAVGQPPSAARYRSDLWPPPLRRPAAGRAA